ncbi:MAG: HAD family phosphatase [Flavobacteriales bacterium]|nr:HAD family phosphatase [Flavobacteriales bacterium]
MSTKQLPNPQDLDAIILDFGGVLFDIDYFAPHRAFQDLGMNNFQEIYSQASQTDLFDRLETGNISNKDFIDALHQYVPEGVTKEQVLHAWNVILLDIPKARVDFVHQLKDKYRMFLLSNTNAIHVAEFEQIIDRRMGLDYFRAGFDKVHYSNVLGKKKPYPETYLHVCALHGLDPKRTLFVDDSVQHVEGALKAGLHSYHLELPEEEFTEVFSYLV